MSGFRQDVRFAHTPEGLRLAYAISGAGYPLVRAATWMSNLDYDWRMEVFGALFRELAARYCFYRYDSRGYGLSEGREREITIDTLVTDLETVVDDACLDRFALWGGGAAGALASIAYAVRHPQRVSHLVLSAPVARGRLTERSTVQEKERFLAFVKLIELGWGEDNPAFRQILNTQMFPRATPVQMSELNELFRTSTTPRHAARMAMTTGQADLAALLPHIACPTLVLQCRGSLLVPLEEARLTAASINGARFVLLETDNYVPLPDEPAFERFVAEFDSFLPRKQAASRASVLAELTRREREVLDLIARGLDNNDIAAQLHVAEKTVRNTVSHIFDKLSVKNRAQAVVRARQAGLGE